jgi:hypothetical protein
MHRAGLLLLCLLLAACGRQELAVCGGCPGPGYVLRGLPDGLAHAEVTLCLSGTPCTSTREQGRIVTGDLRYLALPTGADWADYDGRTLRVSLRTSSAGWRGTGSLSYRPSSGGTCDCAYLTAVVPLTAVSRRG